MTRTTNLPSKRFHCLIYQEDLEFLDERFGRGGGDKPIGVGFAIREMIHQRVMRLKARIQEEIDKGSQG